MKGMIGPEQVKGAGVFGLTHLIQVCTNGLFGYLSCNGFFNLCVDYQRKKSYNFFTYVIYMMFWFF